MGRSAPFFWCNPRFRAQPGIPINEYGVDVLKKTHWSEPPDTWKEELTIRICILDEEDPVQSTGQLKSVSADEVRDAFVFALADAVDRGRKEELTRWRKLILTTPAIFEPIGRESDIFLRSSQLREEATTALAAIKRTPLGRIMEILRFRDQMKTEQKNGVPVTWENVLSLFGVTFLPCASDSGAAALLSCPRLPMRFSIPRIHDSGRSERFKLSKANAPTKLFKNPNKTQCHLPAQPH